MNHSKYMASICLASVAIATPMAAQAQAPTYTINTPAGSAKDTLLRISRATHQSIIFDSALLRGLKAPALSGEFTVQAAIAKALEIVPHGVV